MSKLNVNAPEFVPGTAFSVIVAGPSGSSSSAYFAGGSAEFASTSSSMTLSQHIVSSPEEPIPEPGPSIKRTKTIKKEINKRRSEDMEPSKEKVVNKKKYKELKSLKEHISIVFVGHVDAGKSTIGGKILALAGVVDPRTLKRYEEEAREKSRESWYLSWALDTNQEERDKGKTVEVGRAYFETEKKHITILDAPGHKTFVPNMIGGAAQADLAVLVISARKGEFETGFEKGGQTREHAMLVKTTGVQHLVTVVNKMDDPTVAWDENRYIYCKDKLVVFLKSIGFTPDKDLSFLPVSGLTGQGLLERVSRDVCPWYKGASFIELLNKLPPLNRLLDHPFVMPIADKYKDMGTVLMGKVEAGATHKGSTLLIMPNKVQVTVDQLLINDIEVPQVSSGDNIKIKLKGVEEEEVSLGFVLCDINEPVTTANIFDCQFVIRETKSIICAGYKAIIHVHCAAEEVTVQRLICLVDKKTGEKSKSRPRFVKQGQVVIMRMESAGAICIETSNQFPHLGRVALRDEDKTVAYGKVLKIIK